jgi:catechol 2,3-dioxygenase-like lactoylglutathione lyase family enzyme
VSDQAALQRAADVLRLRGLAADGPRAFESVHGPAVRVRDADGLLFELTVPVAPVARPAGTRPFSFVKLSHVNLRSPDPARGAAWWQRHLDLRLTEYIPDTFYWLRCNPEHTHVALVRGPQAGLHHVGFIIESWNDVKLMLDHLASNGVQIEYGPGRHGPGNSIFVYFVDPYGVRWEALCEMELIGDDATHKVKVWDQVAGRLGAVNLWGGPKPPETFK